MDALNSTGTLSASLSAFSAADGNALPSKPSFRSKLPLLPGKDHTAAVESANQYFASNWPWKSVDEYQRFLTHDLTWWGAFAAPDMLYDRMETAALLCALGFLLDDAIETCAPEQVKRFANRFEGLVFGTIPPENQMECAVADIYGRMRATDGTFYCKEHYLWLKESMGRGRADSSTLDSLDNYLKHRINDVGVILAMSLTDWWYNIKVPQHIKDDSSFKELILTCGLYGIFVNDLFSYRREVLEARMSGSDGILMNSISVVMHEKHLNENDAIRYVEDRLCSLEASLPDIEAELKKNYTGEDLEFCERYSKLVQGLYRGNADWSASCGRYSSRQLSYESLRPDTGII
ncbi:isoprenoid synthase domain-containing protein [Crucibulum laeve]|uniref:Isoprenoid synthase domain-containing protein n=1 Tax=Crucibulum laeve TaxID=68775 RepID=A0A5C3LMQ3_9AGAR|nr:isoprenoid synthase domain-containing protein [Crucibulum laeve]